MSIELNAYAFFGLYGLIPFFCLAGFACLIGFLVDARHKEKHPERPHYRYGYCFAAYQLLRTCLILILGSIGYFYSSTFLNEFINSFETSGILHYVLSLGYVSLSILLWAYGLWLILLPLILSVLSLKRSRLAFVLLSVFTFDVFIITANALYLIYFYLQGRKLGIPPLPALDKAEPSHDPLHDKPSA